MVVLSSFLTCRLCGRRHSPRPVCPVLALHVVSDLPKALRDIVALHQHTHLTAGKVKGLAGMRHTLSSPAPPPLSHAA